MDPPVRDHVHIYRQLEIITPRSLTSLPTTSPIPAIIFRAKSRWHFTGIHFLMHKKMLSLLCPDMILNSTLNTYCMPGIGL